MTGTRETVVTLSQPGRVIDVLGRCIGMRVGEGRSGWSAANHLGRDLERFYGVRAPIPTIEHALRVLQRRRQVRLCVDDGGTVWYHVA